MEFNSKDYISRFYFMKYDHTNTNRYCQKVSANLCLKELKIEILNSSNKVIAVFGYRLDYVFDTLLPLVKWELFEKTRDTSGWDLPNNWGYRDGWGYKFLCMNENGKPLIQNDIDIYFLLFLL